MALIRCPDCGNEHSDAAKACPHCGRPVSLGESPLAHLDDEQLHGIILCGKYQLEYPVGKGGMAYVYRAKHVQFNRPVAIKLIFRHLVKEEVMQYRFRMEAQIQFSLQHPNIVRVLDFVEEQGLLGFVMDWVEGLTLSQWLRNQTFPTTPDLFMPIIGPLLEGMHYAHSQRVIHRDLKPGNLLLAETERGIVPKVVDFGIAKVMDNVNEGHTVTGHSLGTPTYMSPEQIRSSKEIDHRCDLYSLAVILFQMITGSPPFKKESPMATAMAHLEERVPRIDIVCSGADVRFQPVLEKALSKNREDRYPDGQSFLAALQNAIQDGEFASEKSRPAADLSSSFPASSTTPRASPSSASALPSSSLLSEPSTLSFGIAAGSPPSNTTAPSSSTSAVAPSSSASAVAPSSSASAVAPPSSEKSPFFAGEKQAGVPSVLAPPSPTPPAASEGPQRVTLPSPSAAARVSVVAPFSDPSVRIANPSTGGISPSSTGMPAIGALPPMGAMSSPSLTNLPPFPSLSSPNAPLSRGSGVFPAASSPALAYSEDGSNTPMPPWQSRNQPPVSAPKGPSHAKNSPSHTNLGQVSHPEDPPTPSPFLKLASPEIPHATSESNDRLEALLGDPSPPRDRASDWRKWRMFGALAGAFVLLVLVGLWLFGRTTQPPKELVFSLLLNSNPQGAEVLEGSVSKGRTPLRLQAKQGQEIAVVLKRDGFVERSYTWIAKKSEIQHVVLRKLYRLSIKTNPSEASVFLDEKLVGTTPYPLLVPEGKVVQIRLVKKGHITRNISWKAQRSEEQMVYLAPDVFD
ncbi:protein kinase [Myxococcota bacterium]|nr:protein kinase [Myxococcota bacterium]